MKKIIIAFDGRNFSEGAMRMAEWLNEGQTMLMTGVFLSPVDYRDVIGYTGAGMSGAVVLPEIGVDDVPIRENIARFEEACIRMGFEYRVHRDTDFFALQELIRETRFADLMILSGETFYQNIDSEQPNEYLKRTLHGSECPVMVVPEDFTVPASLALAYDGKASSVHALKQFAYLFPERCDMDSILVSAEEESDAEMPNAELVSELAARHFPNLTLKNAAGRDREALVDWIHARKGCLLVSGAFGRGEMSNLFRKSFATELIRSHRIPLFITHR
jgi:nucleotide-binding universal stress UspA family protein